MSATFARSRGMEAPMVGIEFTNRSKTIPAWRVTAQEKENANNPHLKRTHDAALPPPAPFDPKKNAQDIPQPVFGENLRYLFRPPSLAQPPTNAWGSASGPSQEIPEVDMKDIELSPPRPPPRQSFGQASSEAAERRESKSQREDSESPERRLISNAAVRRIARRRQNPRSGTRVNRLRGKSKATDLDEEDGSTDEDGEDEDDGSLRVGRRVTRNTSNHYTLNMPGPAPVKTDTPYILLGYLQFMFNLSLVLLFLYLLVQFIFTVQHDVEQRIGEYSAEILQEITTCTQLYKQNLCETSPIPAMLHQCATWETCMSRDPKVVGRAKVGAEMLAEVVNGFVEPISWKTLLFTLSSLAFMTVFVNGLVMLYRSRFHPDRHPAPVPALPPQPQPQPQPQLQPSSSSSTSTSSHTPIQIPHFPPFQPAYGGYLPPPTPTQQAHIPWHPAAAASERDIDTDGLPRQRRRLGNGPAKSLT